MKKRKGREQKAAKERGVGEKNSIITLSRKVAHISSLPRNLKS